MFLREELPEVLCMELGLHLSDLMVGSKVIVAAGDPLSNLAGGVAEYLYWSNFSIM